MHIGMNKAGSSSIQSFLANNAAHLEKNNIHYPVSLHPQNKSIFATIRAACTKPIQKKILNYAVMEDYWHGLWIKEFTSKEENTIISSEQLLFFSQEEIRRLKTMLGQYFEQITVICYVRDFDSFVNSSIQQRIKNGSDSIIKQMNTLIDNCDYRRILNWMEICPDYDFCLRPFRCDAFYKKDLIQDFFHSIKLDVSGLEERIAPHDNPSLGLYAVLFLEKYNTKYPLMKKNKLNMERGLCHGRIPLQVMASVKDLPFRLDIGYSQEQVDEINGYIQRINRYLSPNDQLKLLHPKEGRIAEQLTTRIPKSFYLELFTAYKAYLEKEADRS